VLRLLYNNAIVLDNFFPLFLLGGLKVF